MTSSSQDMATTPDMAAPLPPPAYVGTGMMAADLSCLGTRMDPAAPTTDTTVMGTVKDFQNSYPVMGAVVSVYFTNDDVVNHHPAAQSMPSDAMGNYTLVVPAGHYRVILGNAGGLAVKSDGTTIMTIPAYEFGRIYNDKDRAAVTTETRDLIPGLVGVTQLDQDGVFAGSVRDCQDRLVGGGQVDVTMTSASYDQAMNLFYFRTVSGMPIPLHTQKWTSDLGLFAALNVPPGTATMEAHVVPTAGAQIVTLGATTVPILAGAITIADVLPAPAK